MCITCAGAPFGDPSQALLPNLHVEFGPDALGQELDSQVCWWSLDATGFSLNYEHSSGGSSSQNTVWTDDNTYFLSLRNNTSGSFTRRIIFQNYQNCFVSRADLTDITSFGLTSQSDNVSFCLENLILLPSQVHSSGEMTFRNANASQILLHVLEAALGH